MMWFRLRRLITARRVIALVTSQRLVCCWQEGDGWRWRSGQLPSGWLRQGVPLQREAMAELLADLLLDCDLVGVQLELLLPPEAVHWRVLEDWGPQQDSAAALSPDEWLELGWPLEASNSYVCVSPWAGQVLLVGVPRPTLQAWIDVVELADLSLRRVDWTVSSALRSLTLGPDPGSGDLALVFAEESGIRLVLSRDGMPELDCCIDVGDSSLLALELRRRVAAWQTHAGGSRPLAWCLSLPESWLEQLEGLIDPDRQESLVGTSESWCPLAVSPDDDANGLLALERLALLGMREDIHA